MMDKKGFEFSFGWIFAIIVGAAVMFLAVYAVVNLVRSEQQVSDSEAAKQLGIILHPLETNLESGKMTTISFGTETRLFNECKSTGAFGEQGISISSRSSVGEAWGRPGAPSTFTHKYIFSPSTLEGKEALVFAKPFNFPFKVADLIYLVPTNISYCLVNAPREIEEEISALQPKNINVSSSVSACRRGSVRVCFATSGCDIDVNLQAQTVKKNKQTLYYADTDDSYALLYGAIFSDPGIYECQTKRLMARTSELSLLYTAKSQRLSARGCSSNLEGQLLLYANATRSFNSSSNIRIINQYAQQLGRNNALLSCNLF